MNITFIPDIRSLFSVLVASSMTLLETLVVFSCEDLEHIVREEVNGGDDHINAISIFPNLREVEITRCDKLECLFPASCSTNLVHLESVFVSKASQLKCVFGKSCSDDKSLHQDQNTEIYLPALNKLNLRKVQNMVSICPENYSVKAPSLKDVTLGTCPQLPINSFIDLSVKGHKRQGQLSREKVMGMHLCNLKNLCLESLDDMETIYDLQRLESASAMNSSLETLILIDMDQLRNICVGPKDHHLRFQNLFKLEIVECPQLKFIFCASIVRSLPYLRHLEVTDCKELEGIIEDDEGEGEEECCFPNLHRIIVSDCERLKCLFSISKSNSLPQLSILVTDNNPELERAFGATQEMDIKHVLPKLFMICLVALPKLHTICSAIDFQPVLCRYVRDCPNTTLTSTDVKFIEGYAMWLQKSEREKGGMAEDYIDEQFFERLREVAEKTMKRDRQIARQNNGSSNSKEISEASLKESLISEEATEANEVKDSEKTQQPEPAPSQIESSHIKEIAEASVEESPKSEEANKAGEVKDSEQTNNPAPFTAPPQNMEVSVGETSNEIAMTTETSSPLIPSTTTPQKHQITTSSTETKSERSQSELLDIYTTKSSQDKIKAPREEICTPCVSKQLEDDDLMRIFQIMEKGADMEAQMLYASKITAHEDDNEVAKALADLEASLKIGLKEIAASEECRLCLENSLNTLSSHCSDDGLKATIHSLQQEIQTLLSSFKQAYANIDTVVELERKEKLMIAQCSQRKEAAMNLLSKIHKTQECMIEAKRREAELDEQISKLQTEMYSKENEIKKCEMELSSLNEEKKKSVSKTIRFINELEVVKKERSHMVEDQINVDSKWSSCLANLKKTSLLLGVHFKHNL